MAKKSKKGRFSGKVKSNIQKTKFDSNSYGYLSLPSGVSVFKPEKGIAKFDIIPYLVTDKKHMDRDDDDVVAVPGEAWYRKPFKISQIWSLSAAIQAKLS